MKALVLHGFTASVDTVSLLAQTLENKGAKVAMPVLRGHGTVPEHLFRVHWRDWVADARAALLKLAPTEKDPVVIAGLSVGAVIGCVLAAEFPNRVTRLGLVAPAFSFRSKLIHLLPLLKRVYRTWSGNPEFANPELVFQNTNYLNFPIETFEQVLALTKMTEALLPQVQCPAAAFYAKKDPVVPPAVIRMLDKKLGSGLAERHTYKRSYHEMFLDVEAETVTEDVVRFLYSTQK